MLRKIAYFSLCFFVFCIPWEDMVVFPWIGTFARLAGIIALAFSLGVILYSGKIKMPYAYTIFFIFIIYAAMTIYWSINLDASLLKLLIYIQNLGMILILFNLINNENELKNIYRAYLLGTLVLLISIFHNYFTNAYMFDYRYSANNCNPNDIAANISLGFPLAAYMVFRKSQLKNKRQIFYLFLYFLIGFWGIVLTGSRGAFIITTLVLFYLLNFVINLKNIPRFLLMIIGVVVIYSFVISNSPGAGQFNRLSTITEEITKGDFNYRTVIWSAGWTVFQESPWLGYGIGTFPDAINNLVGNLPPHNVFLNFLVEEGLVGFMIWLTLLAVVLYFILKMRNLEKKIWLSIFFILLVLFNISNWEWRKQMWFFLGMAIIHSKILYFNRSEPKKRT